MPENKVDHTPEAFKPWLFKKGQSGNPGGRSKVQVEVQAILDGAGPAAGARLLELMMHDDPKVALAATRDILDRVIGKPAEVTPDGQAVMTPIALALLELAQRKL